MTLLELIQRLADLNQSLNRGDYEVVIECYEDSQFSYRRFEIRIDDEAQEIRIRLRED